MSTIKGMIRKIRPTTLIKTLISLGALGTIVVVVVLAGTYMFRQSKCDWENEDFWKKAGSAEVKECLEVSEEPESSEVLSFIDSLFNPNGLTPDARSGNGGKTPLHYAAQWSGKSDVIDVLVTHGADSNEDKQDRVNEEDMGGRTPLHYAAGWNRDPEIIRRLLEVKGVEVNAKDGKGDTPLHLARRCENHAIANVLIDDGKANPRPTNNAGELPSTLSSREKPAGCRK